MRWRFQVTRDSLIIFVALTLGVYEVLAGGGRPAVLTFCAALLASPLVIRVDEYKRATKVRETAAGDPGTGD